MSQIVDMSDAWRPPRQQRVSEWADESLRLEDGGNDSQVCFRVRQIAGLREDDDSMEIQRDLRLIGLVNREIGDHGHRAVVNQVALIDRIVGRGEAVDHSGVKLDSSTTMGSGN